MRRSDIASLAVGLAFTAALGSAALAEETPACKLEHPFCERTSASDPACAQAIQLPADVAGRVQKATNAATFLRDLDENGGSPFAAPGSGGLCCGRVWTVSESLTVYRAWAPRLNSKDKPAAKKTEGWESYSGNYQFGQWWALEAPPASREAFEKMDDVCSSWHALTVYTECQIKVGTQIIIGRGQGECCSATESLPQSEALQVWVPNYSGMPGTQGWFEECSTYVWWPPMAGSH